MTIFDYLMVPICILFGIIGIWFGISAIIELGHRDYTSGQLKYKPSKYKKHGKIGHFLNVFVRFLSN